jgi:transcriptional regulator of met regulon
VIPLPSVEEVVRVLRLPTKERTKEEVTNISRYFSEKQFFKAFKEQGNEEVVDQCSKEMHVEIAHKGKHIITFGDFGMTFYVVLQGKVDVYIPRKD